MSDLEPGEITYAAAISNETADGHMDVQVLVCEAEWDGQGYEPALTDRAALDPVSLPVLTSDPESWDKAEDAAAEVLGDHGWGITGDWEYGDGCAAYAGAVPLPGNPLYEEG